MSCHEASAGRSRGIAALDGWPSGSVTLADPSERTAPARSKEVASWIEALWMYASGEFMPRTFEGRSRHEESKAISAQSACDKTVASNLACFLHPHPKS